MTTFFLIRHAAYDGIERKLAGRARGLHLNETGKSQARKLAGRLTGAGLGHIYSSPLERALETAEIVAREVNLEVEARENLNEIDFGEWTGRSLESLVEDPIWKCFNSFRSGTRVPGGESMPEAQGRIIGEIEALSRLQPEARVGIVSHSDLIKATLAQFAGIHLDLFQRIEIWPCSISIVTLDEHGPRVVTVNNTHDL